MSAHNTDWWWGPGNPDATTVVAIAPGPEHDPGYAAQLRSHFRHVRVAATLSNPYGVHNVEQGGHIYVCTGPRRPGERCGRSSAITRSRENGNDQGGRVPEATTASVREAPVQPADRFGVTTRRCTTAGWGSRR